MRNAPAVISVLLLAVVAPTPTVPPLSNTLANARYIYVAAYDGDQFDPNLLPDDRQAIAAVQDAIQKSGKFILVYQPDQADIVLMVQSRPSEDVLAVYDGHGPRSQYLWRVMGRSGLQENETPLVTQFLLAFEKMPGKTPGRRVRTSSTDSASS